MKAASELRIELPTLCLQARVWGDPALPRLLALHGWLDNAASFDRLAPLLCEHFHIVAIDLPGHGHSDHRPAGAWYHYVDYLGDVLAAADALHWPTFGLLGHSLGGAVASALAAACPERIERLFLVEALGPISSEADQSLVQLRRALHQRETFNTKALRVFATEAEAAEVRAHAGGLSSDAAHILVTRGLKRVPGGFSWSSDSRLTLASPQRYTEAQIHIMLCGIRAPVHLVLAQPAPSFLPAEVMNVADCAGAGYRGGAACRKPSPASGKSRTRGQRDARARETRECHHACYA